MDSKEDGSHLVVKGEKFIFLKNSLDDDNLRRVFYHEMSYVINHSDLNEVYNFTYSAHSKIECEANRDMIKAEIAYYVNYCDNDESCLMDWKKIADSMRLPITATNEWLIKEELSEYFTN